jgi:hypothetical protein
MSLIKESEGIYCDFSRQRVTAKTLEVRCRIARISMGNCLPSVISHGMRLTASLHQRCVVGQLQYVHVLRR